MARTDINAYLAGYNAEDKKIFLQIDGLPFERLNYAIEKNYMPTLKKNLRKGYKIYNVFSELPSNTPAAQMKIMYGVSNKIRAFRWYNKKTKEHYTFKTPKTADHWEGEASRASAGGILKDGASYINLYSGGASRSIMTLSKALDTDIKKRLKSNEVWKFIFLNADFITMLIYRLGKEFFTELYEYVKYNIKKKPQRDEKFFPYVRLGNSVFFRDISVMGAMLEMNEGVPKIYITFMAFDELGHQRGPHTKEAAKTLRGIDAAIKKIYKKGKLKGYDFYIFSDHGQTPCIPFEDKYGKTIREFIKEVSIPGTDVGSYNTTHENTEFMLFYVLKKIFKGILSVGNSFFNYFARIIKYIFIKGKEKINVEKEKKDDDIIVANSGPLSHIYFTYDSERLNLDNLEREYSGIFEKIIGHEGIEFGVVRKNDGYLIKGHHGEILTDKELKIISKEKNVFKNIEMEEATVLESMNDIISGEDSGDIIIFGAIIEKNFIINFEKQYGAHGGIGGEQNDAFLITNTDLGDEELGISDLYKIFSRKEVKKNDTDLQEN